MSSEFDEESDIMESEEEESQSSSEPESSSEASGSSEEERTTYARDLCEWLDQIKSNADFASSGPLDSFVDPQITVNGLGPVSLPLNEKVAKDIISACRQAPFGQGSETIVDTSVRNTWELDPSSFQIQNPKWDDFMTQLVNRVSKELGIGNDGSNVSAELHKMLLYEKGALFKAHQDTEKAPRMFGTLVICLPSAHKGGAVQVKHAGQEKTFRTDNVDQSYICWYADVMHEVTEVTSGHRWVLTYNLIGNGPNCQPLVTDPGLGRPLVQSSFIEWRDAYLAGKAWEGQYCYILEHKYTDANLHIDFLKGNDRFRAQALKELCAETNFCLFVANLEREVWGGCYEEDCPYGGPAPKHKHKDLSNGYDNGYHTIDYDEEVTMRLKRVVDQSGNTVAENVAIGEYDVVQLHPFRRAPDEEDHMPYWGNEGAQATHWYRNTVLVVMPRAHLPHFLLNMLRAPSPKPAVGEIIRPNSSKPPIDICSPANRFKQEFDTHPEDPQRRDDLESLSKGILAYIRDHKRSGENPDIAVSEVVKSSAALDSIELFEEAASLISLRLEEDALPSLADWVVRKGFQPLRQGVQKLVSNKGRIHVRYGILQDLMQSISTAAGGDEKTTELGVTGWVESTMDETMAGCENVCVQDGPAFVDIIRHSSNPEKTLDIVVSLAKRNLSDTPFTVAVLGNLFASAKSGDLGVPNERATQTLRHLVVEAISSFEMDPDRGYEDPPKWRLTTPTLRGEDLASLFDLIFELQLEEGPEQLLNKMKTEAEQMNEQRPAANGLTFHTIVLPFLRGFITVAQSYGAYWKTSRTAYYSFYENMLSLYLKKHVGDEPMRPQDWTLEPPGCKCELCSLHLRDFLQKPDEKWGRFRFKEEDRKHLQRTLEHSPSCRKDLYSRCKDFSFETINTGAAPCTLLVCKTEAVWQEEWGEWDGRRRSAEKELLQLDAAVKLKEVLGDEYGKVMDMIGIKLPAGTNQNTPPFHATKETPGFIYSDKSAQTLRLYGSVVMGPEIEAGGTMTHAGRPKPKRPLQPRAANLESSRASKTAGTKRTSQAPKTEAKRQRT